MAWSEAERSLIRHYLGIGELFRQAEPRIDAAITSMQAERDGGTRPDNSAELLMRRWLTQLAKIEAKLEELWTTADGLIIDELEVDAYRAMVMLRSEGRRLVGNIARMLSTRPRHDVFSGAQADPDGSTFPDIENGNLRW